ncbi:late competence development ComFB family protein [Sporosarcina limicola]
MEEVIHDVLIKYKDQLHLTCKCERCLDDIMAISLNSLRPRYIVNRNNGPYVRAEYEADCQGATNILLTITKAATQVSKDPRCHSIN